MGLAAGGQRQGGMELAMLLVPVLLLLLPLVVVLLLVLPLLVALLARVV